MGVETNYSKINQERRDKVCVLFEEGYGVIQISEIIKINRTTVSRILVDAKIIETRKDSDNTHEELINNLYLEGNSINYISKEIEKSSNYVSRILRKLNIIDKERTSRTKTINENAFDNLEDEDVAYWLGFLFADGCIHKDFFTIELSLKEEDKEHIKKFLDFMGSDADIKRRKIELNGKTHYASRGVICSTKIARRLNELGCTPNKSLTLKFPELPKESLRHFIRGYFDGDGSVTISKRSINRKSSLSFSLISTEEFLDHYQNILLDLGINKIKYQKTGNAFICTHGGNIVASKFYNYIYTNSTVYLERKHDKFIAVLSGNT